MLILSHQRIENDVADAFSGRVRRSCRQSVKGREFLRQSDGNKVVGCAVTCCRENEQSDENNGKELLQNDTSVNEVVGVPLMRSLKSLLAVRPRRTAQQAGVRRTPAALSAGPLPRRDGRVTPRAAPRRCDLSERRH